MVGDAIQHLRSKLDDLVELTSIWIPPYPRVRLGQVEHVDGHWRDIDSYDELDDDELEAVRRSGGPLTSGGESLGPAPPSAIERLQGQIEPEWRRRLQAAVATRRPPSIVRNFPGMVGWKTRTEGDFYNVEDDSGVLDVPPRVGHAERYAAEQYALETLERKATPFHSTRPVPMRMYRKGIGGQRRRGP